MAGPAAEREDLVHPRSGGAAARTGKRHAPAGAVEAEAHHVGAADARALVEAPPLRQVADAVVRLAGTPPQHRRAPGRERLEPEHRADERRLAGSVRAEHGDEL